MDQAQKGDSKQAVLLTIVSNTAGNMLVQGNGDRQLPGRGYTSSSAGLAAQCLLGSATVEAAMPGLPMRALS